jgi:hypothetical protein
MNAIRTPQNVIEGAPEGRTPRRNTWKNAAAQRVVNNPTEVLQNATDTMGNVVNALEALQVFLRLQQSIAVDTLDTIVFEHETVELPTSQAFYVLNVPAQTRQMEQIDTVFASIIVPPLPGQNPGTAPTITLDNAYAYLGSTGINLNAILNSSGGSGGAIPTPLGVLLNEGSKRQFAIHATANFPPNAFLSVSLVGRTIPATLGEANV